VNWIDIYDEPEGLFLFLDKLTSYFPYLSTFIAFYCPLLLKLCFEFMLFAVSSAYEPTASSWQQDRQW